MNRSGPALVAALGALILLQACSVTTGVVQGPLVRCEGRRLLDWVRSGEPTVSAGDREEALRSGVAMMKVSCREMPRYKADVALYEKRVIKEGVSVPGILANVGLGVGGTVVWLLGTVVVNLPILLIEAAAHCHGSGGDVIVLPYPDLPWQETYDQYTRVVPGEYIEQHDVVVPGEPSEIRTRPLPGHPVAIEFLKDGKAWKSSAGRSDDRGEVSVDLAAAAREARSAKASSMELRVLIPSATAPPPPAISFGSADLERLAGTR